jgi:acyl-CoA synthetase (AMP-forming)/AMP-acid ligase II
VSAYSGLASPADVVARGLAILAKFIDTGDSGFEWPVFDELSASSLFYTSGTTGNPKGGLYSHRSDVLHALTLGGATGFGFVAQDTILPMTPMFHANGWRLGIYPCSADGGSETGIAGPETGRGQYRRID